MKTFTAGPQPSEKRVFMGPNQPVLCSTWLDNSARLNNMDGSYIYNTIEPYNLNIIRDMHGQFSVQI